MLKLARISPIKLVQTTIEVPKYGAKTREPTSSRIMTQAPVVKTMSSSLYFTKTQKTRKHIKHKKQFGSIYNDGGQCQGVFLFSVFSVLSCGLILPQLPAFARIRVCSILRLILVLDFWDSANIKYC